MQPWPDNEAQTETVATTRCSILTVDNDREIRGLLEEAISQLGHDTATAVDGLDALEKMAGRHFDIVITDLSMPRMDGIELIKRIKSDFKEVDVIAVTAYRTRHRYTEVIELGASDFISKPFNLDELEAKINRIIRERGLRTELKSLSIRDGLTGIYNRRYFDENLRRESGRAFRQQYGLFLLLIDIDNFKEYNDRFGHQRGDWLLRELARIMALYIRRNVDSIYRYGGDEFAVIIPHANHQQAMMVAERLRSKFNHSNLGPTSLSIGLARLQGGIETLEKDVQDLLRTADHCLYLAKHGGGDRVCSAGEDRAMADSARPNPDLRPH